MQNRKEKHISKGLELYLITFLSVIQFAVRTLDVCARAQRHHPDCDRDSLFTVTSALLLPPVSLPPCVTKLKLHLLHRRAALMSVTSDAVALCCDVLVLLPGTLLTTSHCDVSRTGRSCLLCFYEKATLGLLSFCCFITIIVYRENPKQEFSVPTGLFVFFLMCFRMFCLRLL